MGNELTIWKKASDVSNALNTVIQTYNIFRSTRKQDMLALSISLENFKREAIAKGAGRLVRTNITEIAETQKYIDECNLSGEALELAMDQLRQLNKSLKENLQAYRSSY